MANECSTASERLQNLSLTLSGVSIPIRKSHIDVYIPQFRSYPNKLNGEAAWDIVGISTVWKGLKAAQAEEILFWEETFKKTVENCVLECLLEKWRDDEERKGNCGVSNPYIKFHEFLNSVAILSFAIDTNTIISRMVEHWDQNGRQHIFFSTTEDFHRTLVSFLNTRECFIPFQEGNPRVSVRVSTECVNGTKLKIHGQLLWVPPSIQYDNPVHSVSREQKYYLAPRLAETPIDSSCAKLPTRVEHVLQCGIMTFVWDAEKQAFRGTLSPDAETSSYVNVRSTMTTFFSQEVHYEREIRSKVALLLAARSAPCQIQTHHRPQTWESWQKWMVAHSHSQSPGPQAQSLQPDTKPIILTKSGQLLSNLTYSQALSPCFDGKPLRKQAYSQCPEIPYSEVLCKEISLPEIQSPILQFHVLLEDAPATSKSVHISESNSSKSAGKRPVSSFSNPHRDATPDYPADDEGSSASSSSVLHEPRCSRSISNQSAASCLKRVDSCHNEVSDAEWEECMDNFISTLDFSNETSTSVSVELVKSFISAFAEDHAKKDMVRQMENFSTIAKRRLSSMDGLCLYLSAGSDTGLDEVQRQMQAYYENLPSRPSAHRFDSSEVHAFERIFLEAPDSDDESSDWDVSWAEYGLEHIEDIALWQ
ncbi:hypothetical protein M501DRAFT_989884 [Patellaria atrata CBS 101060]|uniref:Uncharacterized protein n=1 Tax=Patellaria atrata CBS 101060 TaxID=1346257 RepID=A0A9P4SEU0_9PEZI|nr:hypothetical protein M501DRAFT_989884 [Patellaria atrata CBS 101060]